MENGYCNVSMPVVNTGATIALLQRFLVYPIATYNASITNKSIPDLLVYFNGTIENPNHLNYNLKSGDNVQIKFLLPVTKYAPNSTMSITIYALEAFYYHEFSLNWIA
jgi:hypothetical protein